MTLCVDVGNTRTKLALVNGRTIVRSRSLASTSPASDLRRAAGALARGSRVGVVVVSSVRRESTAVVLRALEQALGIDTVLITHRTPMPIEIAVQKPERVGTDRLCAAVGAIAGGRRSAVVVDAGSAITVDLVLDRRFLGGVIMAGPGTSLAALHRFTSRLPRIEFGPEARSPRRIDDTESAMLWGATLGASGGVRAAATMLQEKCGKRVGTVVTGGFAPRMRPYLPTGWRYQPDLVLLGLAAIGRELGRGR